MEFVKRNRKPQKKLLLSVHLEEDGFSLAYCVFVPGKPSSAIEMIPVESLEKLPDLHKKIPMVLHFHGFGVLARTTENVPNFKETLLVSGDKSDFYFCAFEFHQTVAVSFVRKSLVEPILMVLQEQKAYVFEIHLGPIPLALHLGKKTIIRSDYTLEKRSGEWLHLERTSDNDFQYSIYLDALTTYRAETESAYSQALEPIEIEKVRKDFGEYRRFVSLGIGILSFFLIALIANYFYVNYLNQKASELETEVVAYGENFSLMERLEQEKQRKLILVSNSGIQSENYLSFYLDEIGSLTPDGISFTNVEVFPLIDPLKPKRKVELNMQHIVIKGTSQNSKILDDWMEDMEEMEWVSSVELLNYVRLDDKKSTYHLLIKLKK